MGNKIQGPILDFLMDNPDTWFTIDRLSQVVAMANHKMVTPDLRNSAAGGAAALASEMDEVEHHETKPLYRYVGSRIATGDPKEHDPGNGPFPRGYGVPTINHYVAVPDTLPMDMEAKGTEYPWKIADATGKRIIIKADDGSIHIGKFIGTVEDK